MRPKIFEVTVNLASFFDWIGLLISLRVPLMEMSLVAMCVNLPVDDTWTFHVKHGNAVHMSN